MARQELKMAEIKIFITQCPFLPLANLPFNFGEKSGKAKWG